MATAKWYDDVNKVNEFADVLNDAGQWFDPVPQTVISNLLGYFNKPWHWDDDYLLWEKMGKPRDDADPWEEFLVKLEA